MLNVLMDFFLLNLQKHFKSHHGKRSHTTSFLSTIILHWNPHEEKISFHSYNKIRSNISLMLAFFTLSAYLMKVWQSHFSQCLQHGRFTTLVVSCKIMLQWLKYFQNSNFIFLMEYLVSKIKFLKGDIELTM